MGDLLVGADPGIFQATANGRLNFIPITRTEEVCSNDIGWSRIILLEKLDDVTKVHDRAFDQDVLEPLRVCDRGCRKCERRSCLQLRQP
jgi:hypothetical protein